MSRIVWLGIALVGCTEYELVAQPGLESLLGLDTAVAGPDGESDGPGGVEYEVPSDEFGHEEGGWDDTNGKLDTELIDDWCVLASEIDGFLDPYQVPYDGRVFYCHSGSGNLVLLETDIDACFAHLDHALDVFPTTLCDS